MSRSSRTPTSAGTRPAAAASTIGSAWSTAGIALYPSTDGVKTKVHLRNGGARPWIELEPTDHPLAVEQREGISAARVAEIYAYHEHGVN
jgi:hypothetical protein